MIEYKKANNTVDDIASVLRSSSSITNLSEKSSKLSWEELPPFNSRIRPAEGVVSLNS
ncbi:hypothetical protein IKO50_06485 [bacterium]|nr:hypothetical protein [bacterium]